MSTFELPAAARERLHLDTDGKPPFSAHFGVNELLLLARYGYEPLGQVLGASVFQTGAQWTGGGWRNSERQAAAEKGISFELSQATTAFYQARSLAMERMKEEAQLLGASMVIGARIERHQRGLQDEHSPGVWEFYARGTAIRKVNDTRKSADPVLCSLNAAEVFQLEGAGYHPAGIVAGNCYWVHIPNQNSSWLMTTGAFSRSGRTNQEMGDITNAVYQTREIAMSRLEQEARELKADGVLGLAVETDFPKDVAVGQAVRQGSSMAPPIAIHFFALGTAVRGRGSTAPSEISTTVSVQS